jgi:hypothetical protein
MMTTTNTAATTYSNLVICRLDGSDRLICDEAIGTELVVDLDRVRAAAEWTGCFEAGETVAYFVVTGTTRNPPSAHGCEMPADLQTLVLA